MVSTDDGGIIGYYRIDEKGTVTDILDKSGVVKASFDYDEFGVLGSTEGLDSYGNIFAYTGHVYDDSTGLYYAKARYYDSDNGRFISEDSYKGKINSVVTLNRYIYTRNNPIIYTDPSGNIIGIDDAIIILVFAVGSSVLVTYAYLLTPAGKNAINSGAVAVYKGRVIAGKLITKAAKTAFSAIRAGTIQIGNKIADGITWTGNKINDGVTWVGNKISDAWGSLTSKISGKKESDKGDSETKHKVGQNGTKFQGVKQQEKMVRQKE